MSQRYEIRGSSKLREQACKITCDIDSICPLSVFTGSLKNSQDVFLKRNEVLTRNLASDDYVYIVKSGFVALLTYTESGDRVLFGILGAGQTVGEAESYLDLREVIYLQAIVDSALCRMPMKDYQQHVHANPHAATRVALSTIRNMNAICRCSWIMSDRSVKERLARFFYVVVHSGLGKTRGELELELELSHDDLAFLFSADRGSITKALKKLEAEGVVAPGYRKIIVNALAVDKRISESDVPYPTFVCHA